MVLCFRFTSSTFSAILSMKPRISSTWGPKWDQKWGVGAIRRRRPREVAVWAWVLTSSRQGGRGVAAPSGPSSREV